MRQEGDCAHGMQGGGQVLCRGNGECAAEACVGASREWGGSSPPDLSLAALSFGRPAKSPTKKLSDKSADAMVVVVVVVIGCCVVLRCE